MRKRRKERERGKIKTTKGAGGKKEGRRGEVEVHGRREIQARGRKKETFEEEQERREVEREKRYLEEREILKEERAAAAMELIRDLALREASAAEERERRETSFSSSSWTS